MNKFLLVFGTRPELIKLAPVIQEFTKRNQRDRLYIVNTNQHEDLVKQDLDYFQIEVDHRFQLPKRCDDLSRLTAMLLSEFHELKMKLNTLQIKLCSVITQGDTCTSFCSSQFAFYERIPLVHIEAGLRTLDFNQPFPEEFYRKTISSLAAIHFAPTLSAKQNLMAEGVKQDLIIVTGNTGIDNIRKQFESGRFHYNDAKDGVVLITIHRRENRASNLNSIISRIIFYCNKHPEKSFLWIAHPGNKIESHIDKQPINFKIIQPVSFSEMMKIYKRTNLIITDSGGIQEEAGYLGIPALLFRAKTERTEGIDSGIAKYFEEHDDLDVVTANLNKKTSDYNTIYGDGYASTKIVNFLLEQESGKQGMQARASL
jgi:UDP-N-acetylglucosamine 2-epimerase (non-hydrolysing)